MRTHRASPLRLVGRRLAHVAVSAAMLAPVAMPVVAAVGLTALAASPASAASSTTMVNATNDEQFSLFTKAGEKVNWVVKVAAQTSQPDANYSLKLIDNTGATVATASIPAGSANGVTRTLTATATATNAGVWYAVIDADVIPFNPIGQAAPASLDHQVQHLSWDLNVLSSAGTAIPGRVWFDDGYNVAQQDGNQTKAQLLSNSADMSLWYLDDHGWLYKGDYTNYNGVYSRLYVNHLGLTSTTTGQPLYQSVPVGSAGEVGKPGNPAYKMFPEVPAADLPASATWPDGSVRPLNNSANPLSPTVTSFSFARTNNTSDAGTFTYAIDNFQGVASIVVDTDGSGAPSAGDVTLPSVYDGVTGTVTWDGKDASGTPVPVTKSVKAWVQVDRTGEIHFLNQDVELRGGLQVTRLNGPSAPDTTLYWNDTNLTTDSSHQVATSVKDGTAGVDSTGGVHDLPASNGTTSGDGMNGWGNTRVIDDWTYVPVNATLLTTIPPLAADVKIVKDLTNVGPVPPGDNIDWKVAVTNEGTANATNVVVKDVFQSPVSPAATAMTAPTKGTVSGTSWSVGTLAPGETATVQVHGVIDAGFLGNSVDNLATVTSTEDPYTGNNTVGGTQDNTDLTGDTDNADIVNTPLAMYPPDMRILKTRVGSGTVAAGNTVTYTVQVQNAGQGPATGVSVTDLAPAGLDNVTLSAPSMGTVSGLDWNVGNMAPGAVEQVTVKGTVSATATGDLVNTAVVSSNEDSYIGDPATCQDNTTLAGDTDQCDLVPVTVANPDLRILKERNGTSAIRVGDTVSYKVTVANQGKGAATNVVSSDIAPADLTGVTLSAPSLGTVSGLNWNIGTLPAGQNATVTVTGTVRAGASGNLVNTATVTSVEDPYKGSPASCQDNTDLPGDTDQCDLVRDPITPPDPDLRILKELGTTGSIGVGDTVTYTVYVQNAGGSGATNVTAADLAPAELSNVTLSNPTKGTTSGTDWTIGSLAANETVTVTVKGTVKAGASGKVTNMATTTSTEDPYKGDGTVANAQDNTDLAGDTDQADIVSFTVESPVLKIVKTNETTGSVGVGDTITYKIAVNNSGKVTAHNVTVADAAPAELANVTLSGATAGTVSGTDWTVGDLAAGATETVTVKGVVKAGTTGSVVNVATTKSDENPPNGTPGNCQDNTDLAGDNDQCDPVSVPVDSPALAIVKTVSSQGPYGVGDKVTYEVTVKNTGVVTAHNVTVADAAPAELANVTLSGASAGTVSGLDWTVGDLAAGASETITVEGTIKAGTTGSITNTVTTKSDENGPKGTPGACQDNTDLAGDSDQCDVVDVPVDVPALAILKTNTGAAKVHSGDTVSYKITVKNTGAVTAHGVTVDDMAPAELTNVTLSAASAGSISGTTWTGGDLAAGASADVTVTGVVAKGTSGVISNVAVVKGDENPPNGGPGNCQDNTDLAGDTDQCDPVDVTVADPELKIVKVLDTAGVVKAGDKVAYTVTVKNTGAGDATNVKVDDIAEAALTDVVLSNPSVGTVAGTAWTVGDLGAGADATVKVEGTIAAGTKGNVLNTVVVGSDELPPGDPKNCQDNADVASDTDQCDSVPVPVEVPELKIVKTRVGTGVVKAGEKLTYTVTVKNTGGASAANVVVDDLAPAELSDVALSNATVGSASGLAWTVGDLAAGAEASVTVEGTVKAGTLGKVINTATVGSDELPYKGDPAQCQDNTDLAGDIDQCDLVPVTVGKPDLRIVKDAPKTDALLVPGDTITWTVKVSNVGIVAADKVTVTDTAPAGVTDAKFVDPSVGTVNGLVWTVGTLDKGATESVTVTGVVAEDANGPLRNVAVVDSPDDPSDGTPENCESNADLAADSDQCDDAVTPLAGPDIRINKVGKSDGNGVVNWVIEVENQGSARAREVVVDDLLPASTVPGSVTVLGQPSKGTFDTATGVWTIGRMAKAEKVTINFTTKHTVAALAAGVKNIATVTSIDDPYNGKPTEQCQVNVDLAGDTDQCDEVTIKVTPPVPPHKPPFIDSGVPVIGGMSGREVGVGVGLLTLAAGAGIVLYRRRRDDEDDEHRLAA